MVYRAPAAVRSILRTVGNTPLLKLENVVPPGSAAVYVKLEYFNPTGSYKDRMALAMIEEAEARGDLKPGMTVVEYTGGSTGSSLAFVCAVKGYDFHVVSSDVFAPEKLRTMRVFGAELEIIPGEAGYITPDIIPRMIARAEELAQQNGVYFTNQFHNEDALAGYVVLAEELLQQLDQPIDAFCAGVGTAGMLVGVSRTLRRATDGDRTRIVALEPAGSAVLTTGSAGKHRVEGIGVGFTPPLLDEIDYDEARAIDEDEARIMAQRLAREEGVFGGTSSGLNVVAALQLAQELGPGHTVVTVVVDFGLKYLAGDLYAAT